MLVYQRVNVYITNWNIVLFFDGQINNFDWAMASIAMLVYQRVNRHQITIYRYL